MIKVENLTRRFGRTLAIDNLSFEVKQGEIVGFLGPNGAGKTTTMRILSCFLPATGGKVTIGGFDVFADSLEVRRRIGYLPENVPLYTDMRVKEYLNYRAVLKGLSGKKKKQRVKEMLETCGLEEVSGSVIGRLSKGYKQRLGLADSLVHEPELLILDEPTNHLDLEAITSLNKGLEKFRGTILFSSHDHQLVQTVANRIIEITPKGYIDRVDTTYDEYLANEQIKQQRHELYAGSQ